jgi:hypothetical protein
MYNSGLGVTADYTALIMGDSIIYDSYATTGAVTLDGELEITLLNGFTPLTGESFEIMTFASRTGAFSTITGADIGNGMHFEVSYGATNIILTVVAD